MVRFNSFGSAWAPFAAALLALIVGASADAEIPEKAPEPRPLEETVLDEDFPALDLFDRARKLRPRVGLSEDITLRQDFSGTDVDHFESGLRASVSAPISKEFAIRFLAETKATIFDFHGDSNFLDTNRTGRSFDELMAAQFRLQGGYEFYEGWALSAGTSFSSRWEAGSPFERGIQVGGSLGVAHLFWDRLSVVVGLAVRSQMGRQAIKIGPFFRLGLRITDSIEMQTRGLGLSLAARVNPDLTLYLRGGLEGGNYRLDDRGGEINRGILRDTSLPVRIGCRWKLSKHWRIQAFTGAVFMQKYVLTDNNGNRKYAVSPDPMDPKEKFDSATSRKPAFTGNVTIEYRF